MRTIAFFSTWILTATTPLAQPPDVCKLFDKVELMAILGAEPSDGRGILPGSCAWGAKGVSLSVMAIDLAAEKDALQTVDSIKTGGREGETVKEEPGVGTRAASRVAQYGRTVTLVAADGKRVWNFTLSKVDQKIDADATLPKLRELARKAIAAR